jgi:hypothetical protein
MMGLGAFTMSAQDFAGALEIDVKEMYGLRESIVVHGEYVTQDPEAGGPTITEYQWELRPVDPDGNVGEVIYSQTLEGDPTGDFRFPEAVTFELAPESNYQVCLIATNSDGVRAYSKFGKFLLTDFTLTAENEICCGTDITFMLGYSQQLMVAGNTYHYAVTRCDALGNPTWPLSYYVSNETPWTWGQVFVPNSGLPWPTGVQCDTYYRIDVTITNPTYDRRPVTLTKIIYMTSFKMSANASYCCGAYVTAKATTCPNINVNITNPYHQWQFIPCDAAGNPTGPAVYTTTPMAGINGSTDIIWGGTLGCGQYYLLTCLYNNGPTNTIATRNKVIYIAPSPQPTITMNSNSCGSASFSATPTGAGYTYTWSAYNNNTPFTSAVYPNGSNFGVGPGAFNKVQVTVTNSSGCSGTAVMTGIANTNPTWSGDFTITPVSYGPSSPYYYIQINRVGSTSMTGVTDAFQVQQITNNSAMSWNSCWTATPTWGQNIFLFGYDGATSLGNINNCAPTNYPLGRFMKATPYNNVSYRIEHYITVNGCSKLVTKGFTDAGVFCTGCREGEQAPQLAQAPNMFELFPNPNNGSFTMLFPEATENAQAELYNVMGERVDAFTFSGLTYEYAPAATLAPGIYMLRVTNNGVQSVNKFIVE